MPMSMQAILESLGATDVNLQAIHNAQKTVRKPVKNKSKARVVKNEDDITIEDDLNVDETDQIAEVGDPVVVQPVDDPEAEPVEGDIIEIIDDTEGDGSIVDEVPVLASRAKYRRVANAKIVKNADGTLSAVVPVAQVKNARKTVANGVKYAPVMPSKDYATTETTTMESMSVKNMREKAAKYDALVRNAKARAIANTIDQAIDDAVEEALKKKNASSGGLMNESGKCRRFKNYRRIINADGTEEIEVDNIDSGMVVKNADINPSSPRPDIAVQDNEVADPPTVDAPVVEEESELDGNSPSSATSPQVEVVRNGRVANSGCGPKRGKTAKNEKAVHNAASISVENSDFGEAMDIPSTFPSNNQ